MHCCQSIMVDSMMHGDSIEHGQDLYRLWPVELRVIPYTLFGQMY